MFFLVKYNVTHMMWPNFVYLLTQFKEHQLVIFRSQASGGVLLNLVDTQNSIEINAVVESAITSYNTVCSELLGNIHPI